jgi:hypothetical protein
MKYLSLLFSFILATGCIEASKKAADTSSGNISANGTGNIWVEDGPVFPKTLRISNSFASDEVANIEDMALAWETSINNKENLFEFGPMVNEITSGSMNLQSLNDNVLGIYKSNPWPSSLPSSALAVTQIWGYVYNKGTSDQFIQIKHADILVNFEFHFRTGDDGIGYDLQTVILHELGHFLGLAHSSVDSSQRDLTVMYPSIRSWDDKRVPQPMDVSALSGKYGIKLSSSSASSMAHGPASKRPSLDAGPDEEVAIIIELHADGKCVHKLDGAEVERHQVSF